jgi:hypothetical protein
VVLVVVAAVVLVAAVVVAAAAADHYLVDLLKQPLVQQEQYFQFSPQCAVI